MRAIRDTVLAIILAFLVIGLIGGLTGPSPATSAAPSSSSAPAPFYQLKAEPYHCDKSTSYLTCEGRVKNITDKPMRHVQAAAECFAKDGSFITSDDTILEYDPLLAGQTSPYRILIRYNPAMDTCRISFKYLFGAFIPSIEPDWPEKKPSKRSRQ